MAAWQGHVACCAGDVTLTQTVTVTTTLGTMGVCKAANDLSMNSKRAFPRCLLNLAVLVSATTVTVPAFSQSNDLKTAMQQILAHGDLADTEALSRLFGVTVRIAKVSETSASGTPIHRYRAVVTQSPSFMYANWLRYEVDIRDKETRISLSFRPRKYADLWAWAQEWRLQTKESMLLHGGGSSLTLLPPQTGGVVVYSRLGGIELSQTLPRVVTFPELAMDSRGKGQALIRQVVDLIGAGDLRDVTRTQHILQADFAVDPATLRHGKLYRGAVSLNRTLEGWNSGMFSYSANDSGWGSMPSHNTMPQELRLRTVELTLRPDFTQSCIDASDIAAQLDAQGIPYGMNSTTDSARTFKVHGNNAFVLQATSYDGCVSTLSLSQITDVDHAQTSPLRFLVADSVAKSPLRLSSETRSRLTRMVNSIRTVELQTIEISEYDAAELSILIQAFLIEQGIDSKRIKLNARNLGNTRSVEVRPLAR